MSYFSKVYINDFYFFLKMKNIYNCTNTSYVFIFKIFWVHFNDYFN